MYGDILAYHETLKESESNNITNKKPIKVQETIKVVFGIKCFENKAYVAKKNKSFSEGCERNKHIMIYMTYAGLTLMFQRQ